MNSSVLCICGWSGAGKTTLIEELLPRLNRRGLDVVVVKHDAHGLDIDRPGKDTTRLFDAGAAGVCAFDDNQSFVRAPAPAGLDAILLSIGVPADLVMVEGLKQTPLPKIWLCRPDCEEEIEKDDSVLGILEARPDRLERAETIVVDWLAAQWRARERWVGILIGGASTRMGTAKHLLPLGSGTVLESLVGQVLRICPNVAVLGSGPLPPALAGSVPRLPDVRSAAGPLAGMLAALRWNPQAAWTFLACDMPGLNAQFLDWLQARRRPGVWAVMPRRGDRDRVEPLAAAYEPHARPLLEQLAGRKQYALQPLRECRKVATPGLPAELERCVININTAEEWRAFGHTRPQ